ncbi:phosphoethanolamine transferase [Sulfuricurvum sp.]|uniref:phosphoethanolamine transferase n=1 Tax=Sulfuricurvum sp. TaxID=2025608 RepID=UPI00261F225F|nr:phosphoethanolamine transferase [Sulfuricurvum sp.]MDD2266076.1 phosphoethanolamine transferase [Sulfuricurvum sp.]MDD2783018.1 phosphoethanolamine transferase [Sulfuricurvum sp.]
MKKKIQTEFYTNKSYFYFGTLIALLSMLPQLFFSPNSVHSTYLLITLVLLIMIPKFSKILLSIFIIFINLSNILIGHIALHWGYALADIKPRIEVAFLSPIYETREYMTHYIDYRDYILVFYTFFVLYLLFKFIRHFTHSYKVFRIIGLGVFVSILLSVTFYINPVREFEPFSVPCEVCSVMDDKKKIDQIMQKREEYISHLKILKANKKHQIYDKVIVVMGESANKNHMSLYGYKFPTTPFLDSLRQSRDLYVFNAIAPTNQTRYSLPIDLTEANVHYYENRYYHSCSILTNFKANDYETYWISNQGRVGKNDSSISSMAYEANLSFFANLNYLEAKTDEVLLDYLNKLRTNPGKEMYLVHIMGSHSDYVNRYNTETALFKNAKNIVEEYDNSIHYSDYILSQIFERFKHERLLLIYLSDHGENINLENNGHGFLPPFKDEYTVPFVIYSNVKNPRLDEIYRDNKKGYFNLENFNYIVQYLSGITNHKNLSFSHDVMAVEPSNIFNFDELDFYN